MAFIYQGCILYNYTKQSIHSGKHKAINEKVNAQIEKLNGGPTLDNFICGVADRWSVQSCHPSAAICFNPCTGPESERENTLEKYDQCTSPHVTKCRGAPHNNRKKYYSVCTVQHSVIPRSVIPLKKHLSLCLPIKWIQSIEKENKESMEK